MAILGNNEAPRAEARGFLDAPLPVERNPDPRLPRYIGASIRGLKTAVLSHRDKQYTNYNIYRRTPICKPHELLAFSIIAVKIFRNSLDS